MKLANIDYIKKTTILREGKNLKIGILGGSFNPAHAGHLSISLKAITKLNLNYVIWLITPQNPLKSPLAYSLNQRFEMAKKLAKNYSKIKVIDVEKDFNNNYTHENIKKLIELKAPSNQIIWLMGEDNLKIFHKFKNYNKIAKLVFICVMARERVSFKSLNSKFANIYKKNYTQITKNIFCSVLPKWSFLLITKNSLSSSIIREKNG